ncbi:MAG: ATP-binding cassette domain-containing protein [Candidatus Marithrix sp.]|nr:ATP-binding cassette domain-containing protein [Candidatus Marithrix sp.]
MGKIVSPEYTCPTLTAASLQIQQGVGKEAKIILNGSHVCTFVIEAGKFYYLAGASGVGKSTLLWTLARLHPLVAGTLRFKGKTYTEIPVANWRAEVALLPQKAVILDGTIAENLLYPFHTFQVQKERLHERGKSLPDSDKLYQELNSVGLHDISLERKANSLSGGQQARLALIRLLLTEPCLILADEPTSGVDDIAAALVFKRLQLFCEQGGAVIITSHTYKDHIHSATITLDGNATLQIKNPNEC